MSGTLRFTSKSSWCWAVGLWSGLGDPGQVGFSLCAVSPSEGCGIALIISQHPEAAVPSSIIFMYEERDIFCDGSHVSSVSHCFQGPGSLWWLLGPHAEKLKWSSAE